MASQARSNRILRAFEMHQEQEVELCFRDMETVTRELVFAVDLMDIVMKLSNHRLLNCNHRDCCDRRGPSDFDEEMKTFVELLMKNELKGQALRAMEEILELDRLSYRDFERYIKNWATHVEALPDERTVGNGTHNFWAFCILMAEKCTIAYQRGILKAPRIGIIHMCRVFSSFDIRSVFPSYPWSQIKLVAYDAKGNLEILSTRRI